MNMDTLDTSPVEETSAFYNEQAIENPPLAVQEEVNFDESFAEEDANQRDHPKADEEQENEVDEEEINDHHHSPVIEDNTHSTNVTNGFHATEEAVSISSSDEMCCVCAKRVYPMERFTADKRLYHKTCFRCSKCKRLLGVDFAVNNGLLYCNPHFMEIFKMRGRYDENVEVTVGDEDTHDKSLEEHFEAGPRASTKELLAKFRELETTPSGPDGEENPQHRPSVVDDELPPQDTTRTLAAKWKAMEAATGLPPTPVASSLLQKKSREGAVITSNVRLPTHSAHGPTGEAGGDRSNDSTNSTETGGVSENTPQALPEGVVRSEIGEIRSAEMPQSGTTRNLLARFQAQ